MNIQQKKLKKLCGRAGELIIGVEPMPYSGLPNVKKAWDTVRSCGCDNAGIILDACHSYGARAGIRLQHAGSEGNGELTGYPLKASSSIPASSSREIPRSVSTEEL